MLYVGHNLKFAPDGSMDNGSHLEWIMTWRATADKLLSEPVVTQISEAFMYACNTS